MSDPLYDPRLRQLLIEADQALTELRSPSPGGRTAKEVMRHLDVLHRDIGRRTHDLWQAASIEGGDSIDELTDFESVDSADAGALAAHPVPGVLPDGIWVDRLQDLLALLDAPTDDTDAVALALECSRVQWATVGLTASWAPFPEPIQVALLGLLAARCRWLGEHLAVPVGPSQALQRLREHRLDAGLAVVVALVPDHEPESGTWRGDALHWWDMLTAGLAPDPLPPGEVDPMMYFVAMQIEGDLQDRQALRTTLEQFGPWSNRLGDTWIIESTFSARRIRDKVKQHLHEGERVFVGEFNTNWAGFGMGQSFPDWMKRRNTIRHVES